MDNTVKTRALVVRTANSGDNDKVLTAVSPELGKISIIAKGVKSLKNKNSSGCGLLCLSDFVLKEGRGMYSLMSADCAEGFYHLRDRAESVAYGAYFGSLLESGTEPGIPAAEELRLCLNTLFALTKRPEDGETLKLVYELRLAEVLGLAPYISEECQCGAPATHLSISEGETCCFAHKDPSAVELSRDEMTVLDFILTSELKDTLFFKSPPALISRLGPVSEKYLEYHLGRLPKTLEYLKKFTVR